MLTAISRNWRRMFMTRLTNDQFLWRVPRASLSGTTSQVDLPGVRVQDVRLQNRSGVSLASGLVLVFPNSQWIAGQFTSPDTFTLDTEDAQDVGASDFSLCTTTNGDGFIVASRVPFNVLGIDVGRATTGGAPVYDVAYSQANGSGGIQWGTFPAGTLYSATGYTPPDFSATGERPIVFPLPPPDDFIRTQASGDLVTGLPDGYYAVRVRATTAPASQGANATVIILGRAYGLTAAHADTAIVEFAQHIPLDLESDQPQKVGIGLAALFLAASDGNYVEVHAGPCG